MAFHNHAHVDRPVVAARLQLSIDDGRTWTRATVRRMSRNTFRVAYDNPAARGHQPFHEPAGTARDALGDTVRETALRVYRLR